MGTVIKWGLICHIGVLQPPQNYDICLQNFQSFNKFEETYRKQKRTFRNGDGFVLFLTRPTPVLWGQNFASCGPVENEGKSARHRTDQFYLREFLSHEENIALTPSLQKYLVWHLLSFVLTHTEIYLQSQICATQVSLYSFLWKDH